MECVSLRCVAGGLAASFLAAGSLALAQGWQLETNLLLKADLTLKETFDSNVYLQDLEPLPTVTNAVRPFVESFITSVTPRLALDWKPRTEFGLVASYAPEIATFHATPHESYVAHRAALTFAGQVNIVQWEQFNTLTIIDGTKEGLTFGTPGGSPAIGGIPIRDRRPAIVYRNGFRAFHPHGDWFFRPVAWSYVHDFQTETRSRKLFPYYQNYVDRDDFTVGLDVGYKAFKTAYLIVGYRFGFQNEPPLPGEEIHYSNDYNRFVAGFEGKVTSWMKVVGVVGADHEVELGCRLGDLVAPAHVAGELLDTDDKALVVELGQDRRREVDFDGSERGAGGVPTVIGCRARRVEGALA